MFVLTKDRIVFQHEYFVANEENLSVLCGIIEKYPSMSLTDDILCLILPIYAKLFDLKRLK